MLVPRRLWLSRQRGQDLVEFAVALPLLLIIMIGVIDLGRVFHASITIANASRTGARYATSFGFDVISGSVDLDEEEIIRLTEQEAENSGITLDDVDPFCPGGCAKGGPVIVTVTYNFQFIFNAFMGSGINLTHETEMNIPW